MRTKPRPRRKAPPVVLLFGEDESDRETMKILLEALRPDLVGRVRPQRQPLVLIKGAKPEDVPGRAERIGAVVDAYRERADVACVFAHEDCDAVEPAHVLVAAKVEKALKDLGCEAHAIAPAWETEAWWFLWPKAVQKTHPSWRAPDDYAGKNVGMIRNAKEELKRCVVPRGAKPGKNGFRTYQESDSPRIAGKVAELGLLSAPEATSGSYDRFRRSAAACKA